MAGIDPKTLWEFAKIVSGGKGVEPTNRVQATFLRTDRDGTGWVRLAGSSEETPVNGSSFASAKAGDTVELTIDDGVLSVSGNSSDPAVGQSKVTEIVRPMVDEMGTRLGKSVSVAEAIADAAQKVANAVNQHFFSDSSGIHVTSATQDEWDAQHAGPNVLINSLGQLFRDGLNNLLTLTTENGARALTIWDGAGNAASNILASFGAVVRIGRSNAAHVEVNEDSMSIMQDSDRLYEVAADGISVSIYAGGSTKASGANYTVAYEVALLDWLNRNCTVSGSVVYDSNGADTGMTVGSNNDVLDPSGNPYSTAYAEGIYYNSSAGTFYDLPQLVPMAEVPTAPTHVEMGGVGIDMANNGLGLVSDNINLSKDGDLEITGALTAASITSIQRGVVAQGTTLPAGSYRDETVSFEHAYSTVPTVVVGLNSSSNNSALGQCSVSVRSVNTTGFTARLFNASTVSPVPGFYWIALG